MGESCAGKDTLVKKLEKENICIPVISYTTRPIRECEQEGREHFFITTEEAHEKIRTEKIIAYTKIESPINPGTGYIYFATEEKNKKANTYVIDPNGVKSLEVENKNNLHPVKIYIYVPRWIRMRRAVKRNDSIDTFELRSENEREQFNDLRGQKFYDYKIRNYGPFALYAKLKLKIIIWKEMRYNAG